VEFRVSSGITGDLNVEGSGLRASAHFQFIEYATQVILNRIVAEFKLFADLFIGFALGDLFENPALLGRENIEGIFVPVSALPFFAHHAHHSSSDAGGEDGASRHDVFNRLDETQRIDFLHQVALSSARDGFVDKTITVERSEHQNPKFGVLF